MSIFKSIGKAIKGIGKVAGGAINSTVGKLPIVGGAASHIGNALSGKEPFLQGLVKGGAPLLLGAGSFGLGPAAGLMSKLGSLAGGAPGQTLAKTAGQKLLGAGVPGGGVLGQLGQAVMKNPGKAIAGGAAIANTVGGIAQRKANQKALQSQNDLRNQLMSRLLSGQGQTYNFTPEF